MTMALVLKLPIVCQNLQKYQTINIVLNHVCLRSFSTATTVAAMSDTISQPQFHQQIDPVTQIPTMPNPNFINPNSNVVHN